MSKLSELFEKRKRKKLRAPGGLPFNPQDVEKKSAPAAQKPDVPDVESPEDGNELSEWSTSAHMLRESAAAPPRQRREDSATSSSFQVGVIDQAAFPRRRTFPGVHKWPEEGIAEQAKGKSALSKQSNPTAQRIPRPNTASLRRRANTVSAPSSLPPEYMDLEAAARLMIEKVKASPAAALGRGRTPQDPLSHRSSVVPSGAETPSKQTSPDERSTAFAQEKERSQSLGEPSFNVWNYVAWEGNKEAENITIDPEATTRKYENRHRRKW